jgi:hypothetical protein
MDNKIEAKIIYTVPEVATLLHVNIAYVHKLRKAGLITFLKLGCFKCRKEALDEFLKKYDGQDVDLILKKIELSAVQS